MTNYPQRSYDKLVFEVDGLYSKLYTGFSMHPHKHDSIEIMYVESGNCECIFFDPDRFTTNHVPLSSGEIIAIRAGIFHELHVDENVTCSLKTTEFSMVPVSSDRSLSILISTIQNASNTLNSLLNNDKDYIILIDSVHISQTMTEIIYIHSQYLWDLPDNKYALMQLLISELFCKLDDCIPSETSEKTGILYIKKAQLLISQMLFDPDLSIDSLAKQIGVNKHYLMTLYQRYVGKTILNEIMELRIKHACSLIKNSDMKLIDIGFLCGFNTRQSFYNTFKRFTGVSPTAFKNQYSHITAYSYLNGHGIDYIPDNQEST